MGFENRNGLLSEREKKQVLSNGLKDQEGISKHAENILGRMGFNQD